MKTIIKAFKTWWAAAKVFRVDGILSVITLIVIIWWGLGGSIWLEGAVPILFAYSTWSTIRLNDQRNKINELLP